MLSQEEILHIAKLAKLELSEEEIEKFTPQLSEILDYFQELESIDTESVEPTTNPIDGLVNRFQKNKLSANTLDVKDVIKNAKKSQDNYIQTDQVL